VSYRICRHTKTGPKFAPAECADEPAAFAAGMESLGGLNAHVSEEERVVTVWNSSFACVGVVLDDANGLCAYRLIPVR